MGGDTGDVYAFRAARAPAGLDAAHSGGAGVDRPRLAGRPGGAGAAQCAAARPARRRVAGAVVGPVAALRGAVGAVAGGDESPAADAAGQGGMSARGIFTKTAPDFVMSVEGTRGTPGGRGRFCRFYGFCGAVVRVGSAVAVCPHPGVEQGHARDDEDAGGGPLRVRDDRAGVVVHCLGAGGNAAARYPNSY